MKTLISIIMAVLLMASMVMAISPVSQLDFVDIGDATSEAGHSVNGWSDLWTWGGNYGCADVPNAYSNTFRTIVPKSEVCQDDDMIAYFSMSTSGTANEIKLRHLQGSQSDNYELYYESSPGTWTMLTAPSIVDSFACGDGTWNTDTYSLPSLTGTIQFKVVTFAMPTVNWCGSGAYWCNCYGLNAFSWARLNGVPGSDVPEFGVIAASIAMVGAIAGIIAFRRH